VLKLRQTSWLLKFLRLPNRPIIWAATLLHFIAGLSLILAADRTSRVVAMAPFSGQPEAWGAAMLTSSYLALSALFHEYRVGQATAVTFFGLLPQQAFLFVSAASAMYFVIQSHYATSTGPVDPLFIFVDQLPIMLLALLHPLGLLRMHASIFPVSAANHFQAESGKGVPDNV